MRLANRPIQEIEVFQQESEKCFHSMQNGDSILVDAAEMNGNADLKRIETTLNALADNLRKRNARALPNQTSALEIMLKEHKVCLSLPVLF